MQPEDDVIIVRRKRFDHITLRLRIKNGRTHEANR